MLHIFNFGKNKKTVGPEINWENNKVTNNSTDFLVSAIPPPSAYTNNKKIRKYQKIINKYNISEKYAIELEKLKEFELVIICDDSSSMIYPATKSKNSYEISESRWYQAHKFVKIIIDIMSVFNPDGIDIHYLNRNPILKIKSSNELNQNLYLNLAPYGIAQFDNIVQKVLIDTKISGKKLLLVIFMGSQPNNYKWFNSKIEHMIGSTFITFIPCTDDINTIRSLNDFTNTMENLTVCNDYNSELKQIRHIYGLNSVLSFGDYISKILLNSICPPTNTQNEIIFDQIQINLPTTTNSHLVKSKHKKSCVIS